jgi:aromatic ring-opening dioxygenase catalytic subunit (LigB family)
LTNKRQPNVQYDTEHPAYPILQQIGREITQQVKPKAVVVFSAHWSGGRDEIYVNKDEQTDLIYEFVPPTLPHGWPTALTKRNGQLLRIP